MSRIANNTIHKDEVESVCQQANHLLESLAIIQYVLTEEEQRGLYSIIRNLEFETWERDDHEPNWVFNSNEEISPALQSLLDGVKIAGAHSC